MSPKTQNQLFVFIASLFAIFFIYLLYTDLDIEKTKQALKNANYFWIFISMFLGVFSYWLRAKRWNILFEPLHISIKTKSGFWTIAFTYFMNLIVPRSGEIARATSLYKLEKTPIEKSLGTIVLERIIDLVFLFIFLILTLIFCPKPFEIFINLSDFTLNNNLIIGGVIGGIMILGLLYIYRKKIKALAFYKKVSSFLKGFKEGLLSILKIKQKPLFILYSVAIWLCYFLMTYLVIFSFEATKDIPFNYGFFLMIAGSLGMIFPATGGLAYPLAMRYAFGAIFLALDKPLEAGYDAGNSFGISLYLGQITMVFIFGVLAMGYFAKQKKAS